MKSLLLVFILLVVQPLSAQDYQINGKVQLISYQQGGMVLPPSAYLPKALTNYTVFITSYSKDSKDTIIIDSTITDSLGNFTLKAPEGQYNLLVSSSDGHISKKVVPSQITSPSTTSEKKKEPVIGWYHSDHWTLNIDTPLIVNQSFNNPLLITHYLVSTCMMCP